MTGMKNECAGWSWSRAQYEEGEQVGESAGVVSLSPSGPVAVCHCPGHCLSWSLSGPVTVPVTAHQCCCFWCTYSAALLDDSILFNVLSQSAVGKRRAVINILLCAFCAFCVFGLF